MSQYSQTVKGQKKTFKVLVGRHIFDALTCTVRLCCSHCSTRQTDSSPFYRYCYKKHFNWCRIKFLRNSIWWFFLSLLTQVKIMGERIQYSGQCYCLGSSVCFLHTKWAVLIRNTEYVKQQGNCTQYKNLPNVSGVWPWGWVELWAVVKAWTYQASVKHTILSLRCI